MKIVMWLAPSTRAASMTSLGSDPMKFFNRKMAIGMPKMACANQMEGHALERQRLPNARC